MREMKPSGIDWIGDIPYHWGRCEIKYYCTSVFPGATPSTSVPEYWDGSIPWIPSGSCHDKKITEAPKTITEVGLANSSTKLIPANTALVAMTGATCGNTGYLRFESCANQSVTAFVEDKKRCNSLYLWYLLRAAKEHLLTFQTGGAQAGVNVENCKNLWVPYVPLDEQVRISAFLDSKCARIDEVIEQTRVSIEEYKKLKQAVITQAVTKGIRPDRPMKDSGVEGVGDVREDWDIQRLKTIATILRGGSPRPIEQYIAEDNSGYNWIRIGDSVKGSKYINSTLRKIIPEGLSKTRLIKKGSLILSNSMSFGQPYILNIDGCIHDGWVAFSDISVNKEYLYYFLLSEMAMIQFHQQVAGGVVLNLNVDKIGTTKISIPDEAEQEEIVEYLDKKMSTIDTLIEKKEQLLSELESYKKSVIYEYVTGKKEVPVCQ